MYKSYIQGKLFKFVYYLKIIWHLLRLFSVIYYLIYINRIVNFILWLLYNQSRIHMNLCLLYFLGDSLEIASQQSQSSQGSEEGSQGSKVMHTSHETQNNFQQSQNNAQHSGNSICKESVGLSQGTSSQFTQPYSQFRGCKMSDRVRAVAFLTLGKIDFWVYFLSRIIFAEIRF